MAESSGLANRYITDTERCSHEILRQALGFHVKVAAADVVETLGLDDTAARPIMEALSERIEGLEYAERDALRSHLEGIQHLLGSTATQQSTVSPAELGPVVPDSSLRQAGDSEVPPADHEATEPVDSRQPVDDDAVLQETGTLDFDSEREPRKKRVMLLLSKVFEPDMLDSLGYEQLDRLLELTIERYKGLKIPRLTTEGRIARIEQINGFAAGKTFIELDSEYGHASGVTNSGVTIALRGIKKRSSNDELLQLIARASEEHDLEQGPDDPKDEDEVSSDDTATEMLPTHDVASAIQEFVGEALIHHGEVSDFIEPYIDQDPNITLEVFFDIYSGLDDSQISFDVRTQDVVAARMHVIEGLEVAQVGETLGIDSSVLTKRLQRVINYPLLINAQSATAKLRQLLPLRIDLSDSQDRESAERHSLQETKSYNATIEEFLSSLHVTLAKPAATIKRILDPNGEEVAFNQENEDARAALRELNAELFTDGTIPDAMRLNEAEQNLINMVTTAKAPLSPKRAFWRAKDHAREGDELADPETAIISILTKWSAMLQLPSVDITYERLRSVTV